MVACVLVAKYAWHLPLYRQAQMLLAQGIDISARSVGYAKNRTNSRVNLTSPPRQFDGIR
jgi:transposase